MGTRPKRWWLSVAACVVGLLLLTCTVDRVVAMGLATVIEGDGGEAQDGGLDEATLERTWGQFALTLPIAPCTTGDVLLVDTVDDSLEGGVSLSTRSAAGQTLSLREALFLAANTPGAHRINFDARVFSAGGGAVIHIVDGSLPLPGSVGGTCIDARGRGVTVEFAYPALGHCHDVCIWSLSQGSQMTGLVIKGNAGAVHVSNSLVAGNRFSVNHVAVVASDGAQIGPWNVFGHGSYGVRFDFYYGVNPGLVRISDNFFGVEPSTMADLTLTVSTIAFDRVEFANNVSKAIFNGLGTGGTVSHNRFLRSAFGTLLTISGVNWQIGPGNIIEGSVTSRGNHFFENTIEGEFFAEGLTAPPDDAGVGSVTGVCPGAGKVEVSTRVAGAWSPIGSTACTVAGRWSLARSELSAGLQAATLFTNGDGGVTGRYSAPILIPSTP